MRARGKCQWANASKATMGGTLKLAVINGEFYRDKQDERDRQDILSRGFRMTGGWRRGADAEMETRYQQLECNLVVIIEAVEDAIALGSVSGWLFGRASGYPCAGLRTGIVPTAAETHDAQVRQRGSFRQGQSFHRDGRWAQFSRAGCGGKDGRFTHHRGPLDRTDPRT